MMKAERRGRGMSYRANHEQEGRQDRHRNRNRNEADKQTSRPAAAGCCATRERRGRKAKAATRVGHMHVTDRGASLKASETLWRVRWFASVYILLRRQGQPRPLIRAACLDAAKGPPLVPG